MGDETFSPKPETLRFDHESPFRGTLSFERAMTEIQQIIGRPFRASFQIHNGRAVLVIDIDYEATKAIDHTDARRSAETVRQQFRNIATQEGHPLSHHVLPANQSELRQGQEDRNFGLFFVYFDLPAQRIASLRHLVAVLEQNPPEIVKQHLKQLLSVPEVMLAREIAVQLRTNKPIQSIEKMGRETDAKPQEEEPLGEVVDSDAKPSESGTAGVDQVTVTADADSSDGMDSAEVVDESLTKRDREDLTEFFADGDFSTFTVARKLSLLTKMSPDQWAIALNTIQVSKYNRGSAESCARRVLGQMAFPERGYEEPVQRYTQEITTEKNSALKEFIRDGFSDREVASVIDLFDSYSPVLRHLLLAASPALAKALLLGVEDRGDTRGLQLTADSELYEAVEDMLEYNNIHYSRHPELYEQYKQLSADQQVLLLRGEFAQGMSATGFAQTMLLAAQEQGKFNESRAITAVLNAASNRDEAFNDRFNLNEGFGVEYQLLEPSDKLLFQFASAELARRLLENDFSATGTRAI